MRRAREEAFVGCVLAGVLVFYKSSRLFFSPSRPYREGKAHRAPGNFETPREAAEAYDDLVRRLGLTRERSVNFVKNEGEVVRTGSLTKTCVSREKKKQTEGEMGSLK